MRFHLWAPTARSVTLHIFDDADPATTSVTYTLPFNTETGVYSFSGNDVDVTKWKGKYYLYEVTVFAPSTGKIERNIVTDPYSLSLSTNSGRSQIVDLRDFALMPAGWYTSTVNATATTPEDISIYELHVRDFSAFDESVHTSTAWHLQSLHPARQQRREAPQGAARSRADAYPPAARLRHRHHQRRQEHLAAARLRRPGRPRPDSEDQQSAVTAAANADPFNWGYDPFHYTTPEGSYSTDPDGSTRIVEFREMVKALHDMGFKVVMDVVYNHTNASGQAAKSVLDKVVPGYYHRLNANGQVETSTCCANTASEHAMMEKLMVDSLVVWARDYKIDAFRFDLMGHHMVDNMLAVRSALDDLNHEIDGIDGSAVYLYGEGWNFGEVGNNARGVNATQANLAGTGIGTFSDRLRDAVRGGSPFDSGEDLKNQGWANGLFYDPNAKDQGDADTQKAALLQLTDVVRLGLAGNLRDYQFVNAAGDTVSGAQVDYNGAPAGYTLDPQEQIVYISKHDNQTLYDNNAYRLPVGTSMADRVRTQVVGLSTVLLSQGVPFLHAGSDILRSKSLDRDSYDSGDWFNILDWTYTETGWGCGVPPAGPNQANWGVMKPLLADTALKPAKADIERTNALVREFLQIRYSTPLFRLQTADQVKRHLSFFNTGPEQIPGLIVMLLDDRNFADIDPGHESVLVAFNANDAAQSLTLPSLRGRALTLHPVQQNSLDERVKTATFNSNTGALTVPARTTAVFVEVQENTYEVILPLVLNGASWDSDPVDVALSAAPVRHAIQDEVFYFVLPDRFVNGSTANDFGVGPGGDTITDTLRHGYLPADKGYFHGGDLAGLRSKLDYLQELGVTAVWMTPVFENRAVQGDGTVAGSSAGYHGYWITDFTQIDPHLGSNADLKALVDDAHSRGMKVFFDIITNHTADVIDYAEAQYGYISKEDAPYKDATGNVFDDRDYAGTATFPTLAAATSFPYTPVFRAEADATAKLPDWLNN
ncbi:MAG: pullulanase-type alpha-1,6-glucosidase, partial [Caldilineaceae bacterium]